MPYLILSELSVKLTLWHSYQSAHRIVLTSGSSLFNLFLRFYGFFWPYFHERFHEGIEIKAAAGHRE